LPEPADLRGYYRILGILPNASAEQLKRASRRLAKELHPDQHPNDPNATRKFQILNEAYSILSDPRKRADYDSACIAQQTPEEKSHEITPVTCSSCGAISAQPRYVIFWYVIREQI
jgi:curved DNA-binding protein CbpA